MPTPIVSSVLLLGVSDHSTNEKNNFIKVSWISQFTIPLFHRHSRDVVGRSRGFLRSRPQDFANVSRFSKLLAPAGMTVHNSRSLAKESKVDVMSTSL